MPKVLSRVLKVLLTCLIIVTCSSCDNKEEYLIKDYLNDLAYYSGIDVEKEDSFNNLLKWNIVNKEDIDLLEKELKFSYLNKTITKLIDKDENYLINNGWIKTNNDKSVKKTKAIELIKKAVNEINNVNFDNKFNVKEKSNVKHIDDINDVNNIEVGDYIYIDNINQYKKVAGIKNNNLILEEIRIDDVLEELNIQGTTEINFEEAEVIPYNNLIEETTTYENNKYELLAIKRKSFSKNGFDISYSIKSSGLDVRISKSKTNAPTMYCDFSLSNIKPTYKWEYKDGVIQDAFFKVDFKLTNEVGASVGKYANYYLDLKDESSSNFLNFVKTKIHSKDDEIEATIPICQIKTPIPNVPIANFNIDVVAKVYVSGKVEIVLYNTGTIGFEIKNNNFRVIHDIDNDYDFLIGASLRAVIGLNFNLEATNFRLCDLEFDGGARAAVTTTLHLYDSDGNSKVQELDVPYSILDELAKENKDVRVCGDLSLNWVLDMQINTSKTQLYKYGLSYQKSILDASDQIFNNLTHIENWQFVKNCTRKNRLKIKETKTNSIDANKIVLKKYSLVIINGETVDLPIESLPKGYTLEDLNYFSNDETIASCSNGKVTAKRIGSASIEIKTNDDKYKASINILVSTG